MERQVSVGPDRPVKEDHLWRWTTFSEKFPPGPKRSIYISTEISGNFGIMESTQYQYYFKVTPGLTKYDCLFIQEKEFIPLPQLKSEICPRISAQDLLHICELNGNGGAAGTKAQRKTKPRGLVVDVRPSDEYPLNSINFHLPLHRFQSVVTYHRKVLLSSFY